MNPDEVVAMDAASQGVDLTPLSSGLEKIEKVFTRLLLRSSEVNLKGPTATSTTTTTATASSLTIDANNKGVMEQLQSIPSSGPIFRELSLSASIFDQRPKHMIEKSPPVEGYTRACAYQQGSFAYLFGQVTAVATDMIQRSCIHTCILSHVHPAKYGCMDECMYGWMDGWMHAWTDGWMNRRINGCIDGWIDGLTN